VFAVKGDRAQRRSVSIGHRSNFEAEIQTGLTTDEVVILHPNEQINDGTQVSAH
jgi:HlyD family secretion protein